MIDKILNKIKFLLLKRDIGSYNKFKDRKPFDQLTTTMIDQNKELLRPYYEQYIKEVSRADMAASLELAAFMYTICKINQYTRLLDMGSGLSSFVFRLYANENPRVMVYSVDDDTAWLEKTKDFLRQHKLGVDNILTLDQFLKSEEQGFECILHDLNFIEVRINYVDRMMKIVKSGGLLIFDDVHKPDYFFALLTKVKNIQSKVFSLHPVTHDSFGRFALAVVKE
ncbi:MAG: hypothetical protein KF860_11445 [Cyclobacteriaceae bacterium]|nr:hypothetical protein [Cyclobacteriaceae bacterium]